MLITIVFVNSCTIVQKYQKNIPFVYKNRITIIRSDLKKEEKDVLKTKMMGQLEDSMRIPLKEIAFIINKIKNPPLYDSANANQSARNMKASLTHLGYYNAQVKTIADTSKGIQKRVTTEFRIDLGKLTLIESYQFKLNNQDLQHIANAGIKSSFIQLNKPVTKTDIENEKVRLVDSFRNNGYYKLTAEDLSMKGDTSIAALIATSDNPFDNLLTIEEVNKRRENPTIKLWISQQSGADTMHIKKFHYKNVIIYPDYLQNNNDEAIYKTDTIENCLIKYNRRIFNSDVLIRNLFVKPGDIYSLEAFTRTINGFNKLGAWQNINAQITDSADNLTLVLQLTPAKKYGFDANLETSYSTNSNNNVSVANAGNLLGLSGNLSLQNRNLWKRGIRMTNAIRAGVELNLNAQRGSKQNINSNELSYTNTISIPKLIFPFPNELGRKLSGEQSFISSNVSNTNRIDLFKLFSLGAAFGYELSLKKNRILTIKPLNIEYSNLYGRTAAFDSTLNKNPYLRYSFNTALVIGSTIGISQTKTNRRHPERQRSIKLNFEESGNLFFLLPLNNIGWLPAGLRQFVKLDAEYTNTINFKKSSFVWRSFTGIGIPIGKSDSSLPFFKQYYAGGPNSMRGWPIRGIGPGSKPQSNYNERLLNDRTGDIRLELNGEYRYNLIQIRPNSIYLKGSLFVDIGNIWNFRNTAIGGGYDSLQFRLDPKKIYQQLGVSAGTGFQVDFTYFLIRFDLGFRFKKPYLSQNNGWQIPEITLKNIFGKGENIPDPNNPGATYNDERYRKWRYDNFNFTIGLSYPF